MTLKQAIEKIQRLEKLVCEIKIVASVLGAPHSKLTEIFDLIRDYERQEK